LRPKSGIVFAANNFDYPEKGHLYRRYGTTHRDFPVFGPVMEKFGTLTFP
jgi:hypothetical protein